MVRLVFIAVLVMACASPSLTESVATTEPVTTQCPKVEDDFHVDGEVVTEINIAIRDLLQSPFTYRREQFVGKPLYIRERADGSEYYSGLEVHFTAENAFGARLRGKALVRLDEMEAGCTVILATLID